MNTLALLDRNLRLCPWWSLLLQCGRRIRTAFTIHRFGNVLLNRHYKQYASIYALAIWRWPETEDACGTGLVEPDVQFSFHVILDARGNEATVSFSCIVEAMGWYSYNNAAYTTLYKPCWGRPILGRILPWLVAGAFHSCNKTGGHFAWRWFAVQILYLGYFYILYFRKRLMNRWNLGKYWSVEGTNILTPCLRFPVTEEMCCSVRRIHWRKSRSRPSQVHFCWWTNFWVSTSSYNCSHNRDYISWNTLRPVERYRRGQLPYLEGNIWRRCFWAARYFYISGKRVSKHCHLLLWILRNMCRSIGMACVWNIRKEGYGQETDICF